MQGSDEEAKVGLSAYVRRSVQVSKIAVCYCSWRMLANS